VHSPEPPPVACPKCGCLQIRIIGQSGNPPIVYYSCQNCGHTFGIERTDWSTRAKVRAARQSTTVLIVDDQVEVTATYAQMLTLEGYGVRTALSGEAGLAEAAASRPAAILLDLRMPNLDGLGFLQRLRAHEQLRHTPVAIITGAYFFEDDTLGHLKALGASVYFKPLWIDDLVRVTQELVSQRNSAASV
jgi:CheY-like chemotaxis protein